MRTASECLKIRERKIKEWEEFDKKIKGQWMFIEGKIDSANIDRNTKYIELGKIELYKENIKKLLEFGYFLSEDKNRQVKLYFNKKEYDNINLNCDKKQNLNNSANNEIQVNRKVKDLNYIDWNNLLNKVSNSLVTGRI